MRTIVIVCRDENTFDVHEGTAFIDQLCWDELLGLVAVLTHPTMYKAEPRIPPYRLQSIDALREAERKAREKAEAERKAADEAAAAGRAEEAERLREKAQATEQRAAEKAATFDQRAATVVAPVIHREPPKVAGLQMREVWEYVIVDASKINHAFMMPDEKKIGAQVRALKGDAAAIIGEGVKVTKRMAPASSAA